MHISHNWMHKSAIDDDSLNWNDEPKSPYGSNDVETVSMMMLNDSHVHDEFFIFVQINWNENENEQNSYERNVYNLNMHEAQRGTYEMRCNLCVKCAEQDKIYISRYLSACNKKCELVALIKFLLICLFSLFFTSHIIKIFLHSLISFPWLLNVFIGTKRFICSRDFKIFTTF